MFSMALVRADPDVLAYDRDHSVAHAAVDNAEHSSPHDFC